MGQPDDKKPDTGGAEAEPRPAAAGAPSPSPESPSGSPESEREPVTPAALSPAMLEDRPDKPELVALTEELEYRLSIGELFEGPLDLLLYLIRKHELDIFDIPIAFVAEKYLEYLDVMRTVNIDVASEYLVMAATLAYIKSRMLLPQPEEEEGEEEGEDPRAELVRRLLERERFLEASESLAERALLGYDTFLRPDSRSAEAPPGEAPLARVGMFELVEAFARVLARAKVDLAHEVYLDRLSVSERIQQLTERLREERQLSFYSLFEDAPDPSMVVVTFLALLEMVRQHLVRLLQGEAAGDIGITARETAEDGGAAEEEHEREQG